MRLLAACAFLGLAACEPTTNAEAIEAIDGAVTDARGDARVGGGGVGPSDSCHHDCFGGSQCSAGVVTVYGRGPVPCWAWEGSCPVDRTFLCEKGCRSDGVRYVDYFDPIGPRLLCEEGRPKKAGDRCVSNADCAPTVATKTSETTVENTYLRCDVDAGRCVDAPAPVIADYLAPCGLDSSKVPMGSHGEVSASACPSNVCLYAWTTTCFAEGCTALCAGDHECPPGSVCQPPTYYYGDEPAPGAPYGYCKPGPLNVYGVGLTCASTPDAGADG